MTTFTISDDSLDKIRDQVVVMTGRTLEVVFVLHLLMEPRCVFGHWPRNTSKSDQAWRQGIRGRYQIPARTRGFLGTFYESRCDVMETAARHVQSCGTGIWQD